MTPHYGEYSLSVSSPCYLSLCYSMTTYLASANGVGVLTVPANERGRRPMKILPTAYIPTCKVDYQRMSSCQVLTIFLEERLGRKGW